MEIQTLTTFFMWCTVMNGALLALWIVMLLFAPDWMYRTQSGWLPISREIFDVAMYCFLGAFKIMFLFFNLVPYLALLIVG